MKKIIFIIFIISIGSNAFCKHRDYRAVSLRDAILLKNTKDRMYCSICGMTLHRFYRTNHAADHNHIHDQYCSINCLIEDMIINDRKMSNFKVVDNSTLKFIDSYKAFFVVGSKKPGTMSMVSKYAFGTQAAAIKFLKENGGKIMRFDELLSFVKKRRSKDLAIIKKRQARAIKKGAKLYNKICKKTDKRFYSTSKAKNFLKISKICGDIQGKKLQAIGLYLSHNQ